MKKVCFSNSSNSDSHPTWLFVELRRRLRLGDSELTELLRLVTFDVVRLLPAPAAEAAEDDGGTFLLASLSELP